MQKHAGHKAQMSGKMVVVLICVFLVVFNLVIAGAALWMGSAQGDRITNSSKNWHQEGQYFKYDDFQLRNLVYDLTPYNNTFPCENESVENVTLSPVMWGEPKRFFDICSLKMDGDMVKVLQGKEISSAEGLVVPLGQVNAREYHEFRMCCDNFCNTMRLEAMCQ